VSIIQAWFAADSIRFRVRALKARFRDQRAEFEIIKRHLRPGDIVCDIGANKGSFILWLSRWVRHGQVVAFEPQPKFAQRLAAVCNAIGLNNVRVEAKAVYSHSGHRDLFVPAGHSPGASLTHAAVEAESFTTLSVPVVALDDYFSESDKITLLKIDVEGAELGVLQGAERILRQHAPLLVFECENRHLAPGRVQDVFSWLEAMGYQGSFISHNQVFSISQFDAAVHQRQHGEWFWKRKDYCNNFVFRKASNWP
jgi:FkbM family methyltransferase